MKTNASQESSSLEKKSLNIEACCKNTLENLNEKTWKKIIKKIVHNWRTRGMLHTLSDAQMKDLGLTAVDIEQETNKPLWK